MRIALSANHAGYDLKDVLAAWLREAGHEVSDLGTNRPRASTIRTLGRGTERLRFTPGPNHSEAMMDELAGALVEIWDRLKLRLAA